MQFGIKQIVVSTMQAISGAGYPGVPSLDIIDNVVPFISGEEEKMEAEALKILGNFDGRMVKNADFQLERKLQPSPRKGWTLRISLHQARARPINRRN